MPRTIPGYATCEVPVVTVVIYPYVVGSVPAARRAGHPGSNKGQRGCHADGHPAQSGRTGSPHPRI